MDETKFDWVDDGDGTLSAVYGSLVFVVSPHSNGAWIARISIKGQAIYIEPFSDCEAAVRWCGRRLPEIVDPLVATARAEAALAEREALVFYIDRALRDALGGAFRTVYTLAVADAIRARTTPATLSTETLAAIAEARGLRVVEPELLAPAERERDEARAELATLRADLAALTERMEAEIPAVAEAVRARTIAEYAALVAARAQWAAATVGQRAARREDFAVADALRALAAPQPAPVDASTLDQDPAAGALR